MASEVVMPRLGWTMEVGRVVEWLKRDGEPVDAGELLFSVETDKAVTEVEALDSGVLRIPPDAPVVGAEVAVGEMLAWIVPPGEASPSGGGKAAAADDAPAAAGRRTPADSRQPVPAMPPPGAVQAVSARDARPRISPRARRVAASLGVDWALLVGSGKTGRIAERDVRTAALHPVGAPSPPRASPVVRRLAEALGVDLGRIAAGGPAGRVTLADVRAAAEPVPRPEAVSESTALSPIRRLTALRMAESARTVAPVTLTTEADATELAALRGHLKAELADLEEPVPSLTDLLVKLTALALLQHPDLNASLVDDRIVHHDAVHVGVAVDTERGLLAPVIRDADRKSLHQIAAESAGLIERARAGTASPSDLGGGTFTISNLGMYEIDAFTPIVDLPQCAVLGLGRLVARPMVVDDERETIAVRRMLALSLTFDHRVVDGAPAARFLQRMKRMVERPYGWLTR